MPQADKTILAVSNYYNKLYYFNPDFERLPVEVKKKLKTMLVLHTEEVGGVIVLQFNEQGQLEFQTKAMDDDAYYDEIGSDLKLKELRTKEKDLLQAVETFYQVFGEEESC